MADGLYRFPCPVCLRLFDSRRGLGAHLRQSQCGADIVVDPQGPTLVILPFPPPPTPSPRVAPQGGTPASSRVFASAVQSPQSPCENIETSRRAASLLSPTPFAASPEPAPPDYDAAKDAKDISSFWSSHSPFCPPLAAVPAACRARYPLLWFAKTPRPAVVGAVSLEVVAAAAVSVFDIAERLRVASGNYADWSAEIKRIIASFATVSSAPVPGSALQADFTRAVLAAGEDVKSLRSVPASRLWTIALLAMWRHPSFEQEAPAIHHRLIVASSVAPVSNPEIAEEELFFGRRPLSFDVGGRLVRTSPADSGATFLGEPRQTTHISLPLGLHPQPPTFSPSSTPTRDLVNEVNQNFDKIIARFRAASLSASQPPPPPNVSAAAAPALGPHLSSSAPREESIGVSPTSATVPSLPAISPAVVVPATTPLARHFRVREGKPLLVEWVGPDAQSCPLCPARPVGRNCYASHMSRCHQGEAAVTSREHFATVIEEGSAEVRWVGFAPTRIPKPTEAMSRLVPAPCLATYASAPTEIARGVMQSAAEVETFFRLRNGPVPTVAQLLGRDGARLELLDLRHIPRLAARGIALKVRQRHLAMLRKLRDLDSDLILLPLDAALAEQMLRWKDRLRWRWATLERNMTTMAGALSSLRLYSRHPISVSLGASHLWGAAMRAAAIKAREEEPRAPRPAKWEQVVRIVDDVSLPIWMRQVLLICWLTAARPGCVLQLKAEDLQVSLASEQTLLPFAVIFRRGKGARLRGPYTVHSALQARFLPLLRPLVEGSGYLFPAESANHREQMARRLLAAVRAVDGSLELRSLRRGSLETLSRLGVDERELMQFSGHTQIATLRRYLRWGRADAVASSRALHQAELLTSSPVSGPASPHTTT